MIAKAIRIENFSFRGKQTKTFRGEWKGLKDKPFGSRKIAWVDEFPI